MVIRWHKIIQIPTPPPPTPPTPHITELILQELADFGSPSKNYFLQNSKKH